MQSPVKIVLVGAGFMGKEHLQAARGLTSVKYLGVVDQSLSLAGALADHYGLRVFDDLAAAICRLKPDAVDICVPTPFHRPLIQICAAHRVHVLCEKPLARSREDAQAIRRLAETAGIRVMAAQVIRFWPEYQYVRELVCSASYGPIVAVACQRLSSPPAWNSWIMQAAQGGGAVIDLQIHDMDFILQILGRPETIRAVGRVAQGGINAVYSRLEYPQAIPVAVEASFLMPSSYPFRMFFKIEFEQAVAEMDFWRPKGQRMKLFPHRGAAVFPVPDAANAYRDEIDYFARQMICGEGFDRVPLDESILALELCLASETACQTGQPVILREELP